VRGDALGLLPMRHACLRRLYNDTRGKPDRTPAEFRIGGQAMESVIAKLLQDFEQGKMNRRQLIQSLSLAAAAAAAIAPAARAAGKPLEALYVNHISYEVNDYKKVRDFYVDLLGMKVTEDDGKQCRLVFGNNMLIPGTGLAAALPKWTTSPTPLRTGTRRRMGWRRSSSAAVCSTGGAPRRASTSRTRRGWEDSSADCINDRPTGPSACPRQRYGRKAMIDSSRRTVLTTGAAAAATAAAPQAFAQAPQTSAPQGAPAGAKTGYYEKGNVRIRYAEIGTGFPLLATPGGGLNPRIAV